VPCKAEKEFAFPRFDTLMVHILKPIVAGTVAPRLCDNPICGNATSEVLCSNVTTAARLCDGNATSAYVPRLVRDFEFPPAHMPAREPWVVRGSRLACVRRTPSDNTGKDLNRC
jgi:hypothetical protein